MTASENNVLIIGTGGVGTIVAYGIHFTGKSNLSVVVRRDYQRVSKEGYKINSVDYGEIKGWKPDHVYSSVEKAAESKQVFQFVIITTKNIPDILRPEELATPVITPGVTTIVLIQNGFDIGKPFIKKFPNNYCLSGVSHIGSHNHDGVIEHTGHDKEVIGYFDNPNFTKEQQKAKAEELVALLSNEKNTIVYFNDVKWWRYRKLVYNATLNTVCALTGLDVARLEFSGVLGNVSVPAMKEIVAIAKADGCELPDDIVNDIAHCESGQFFEPSMLVDVKKGNPIELEVILGNVLSVAKELKVETPTLSLVYELLKGIQYKLKEGQGLITVPKTYVSNNIHYSNV
ncbi:unnamed protein product [Ambrosiozyma monospora]|uniref:2-dehydropantoate 2-reductase n=2 Tax=Ambrosiozyma monospora TaxID=43982 RepID=A0A9W6YQY3_AMBMO|nr:unnamed protein product [Ambrosiozyma monospora]